MKAYIAIEPPVIILTEADLQERLNNAIASAKTIAIEELACDLILAVAYQNAWEEFVESFPEGSPIRTAFGRLKVRDL
jgi:hypothetical protein